VGNLGSSSEAILRDLQYSGSDRITTMIVAATDVPQAEDSRAASALQMRRQFLKDRQFSIHLQFWIFDLKKFDRLKIIATLSILPRLQPFDQRGFHRRDYNAGFHAGVW
jgi:hypothetical protein